MKRVAWSACAIVAGSLLVLQVGAIICAVRVETTPRSPRIGNSPETVRLATEGQDPDNFTFLVLGDVRHGTATFERLLGIAAGDAPAFVVVVGDFVGSPQAARHKLFIAEASEDNHPFQLFLVPGNHDVGLDAEFAIEDFEETYGQAQFSFTLGKHLFVMLNNTPACRAPDDYLDFLERVLSEKAADARHIYVFAHSPIPGLTPEQKSNVPHRWRRFAELVKTYGVRYVFTGDHHGYVKAERDGTTYIITGGGGAELYGTHGAFHHMVRVAVTNGRVTDSVIAVEKTRSVPESLERNFMIHLWPTLNDSWLTATAAALALGASLALLVVSVRRMRRLKNA